MTSSSSSSFIFTFTPKANTTNQDENQSIVYLKLPVHELHFYGFYPQKSNIPSSSRKVTNGKLPGDILMDNFGLIQRIYEENCLWLFHQFIPNFKEEEEQESGKTLKKNYRILKIEISQTRQHQSYDRFFLLYPFIFIFGHNGFHTDEMIERKNSLIAKAKHAFKCLYPSFATTDMDLCIVSLYDKKLDFQFHLLLSSVINQIANDYLTLRFRFQNVIFSRQIVDSSPSRPVLNITLSSSDSYNGLETLTDFIPSPRGIYDFADQDNPTKKKQLKNLTYILIHLFEKRWAGVPDAKKALFRGELPHLSWSEIEQQLLNYSKPVIPTQDKLTEMIEELTSEYYSKKSELFEIYFENAILENFLKLSKMEKKN